MKAYIYQLLESSSGELTLETIGLRLAVAAVIAAFLFLSLPPVAQRQHLQRQVQCHLGGADRHHHHRHDRHRQ